ncbi:PP2C family protein-serine/threonine phosphatase [Streptomyces sp. NPDC019396]|uniref:PP2C family protein-serine/threonine phosphatase n=1 Tax=Streptomyces sp. NPDC019396 TaxID=3154687 RepID=UPI0033DC2714
MDTHVVYEPAEEGALAGGDFYDLFRTTDGRWCFALGDVCGHGPEAAVVVGIVRPLLKILAEDGFSVPGLLNRLNRVLVDDSMPSVGITAVGNACREEDIKPVSLLYGELRSDSQGSLQCTLASAGHPMPLLLHAHGQVEHAAEPQLLLGVTEQSAYQSQSFVFKPGDTLLCVTDGVTEKRSGLRQFDDEEGLSRVLSSCVGLGAAGVAELIRQAVHSFGDAAPQDDLALLVLQARQPSEVLKQESLRAIVTPQSVVA